VDNGELISRIVLLQVFARINIITTHITHWNLLWVGEFNYCYGLIAIAGKYCWSAQRNKTSIHQSLLKYFRKIPHFLTFSL
jgi:hypothetical protein